MKNLPLALALVCGLAASAARATPTVDVYLNNTTYVSSVTPSLHHTASGISWYTIAYTHPSNSNSYTLRVRGASTDGIYSLLVTPYSGGETVIDVSANGVNPFGPIRTIQEYNGGGASGSVILSNLITVGDMGDTGLAEPALKVDAIINAEIDGNVTNDITATATRIDTLHITGDMEASISGYLEVRDVTIDGSFGSSAHPKDVQYGDVLRHLTAGSIYGAIYSNRLAAATPTIWSIETTDGPFVGYLQCEVFHSTSGAAGMSIDGGATAANGVLDADISILTSIDEDITASGGLASGRTVTIAGGYGASYETITLPSGGLEGQIIINATNNSSSWSSGSLSVGGAISSIPYYSATGLGGGAVGLVPFHQYETDCFPAEGATMAVPTTGSTLSYRFYGPVKKYAATSDPYIKIEPGQARGAM